MQATLFILLEDIQSFYKSGLNHEAMEIICTSKLILGAIKHLDKTLAINPKNVDALYNKDVSRYTYNKNR